MTATPPRHQNTRRPVVTFWVWLLSILALGVIGFAVGRYTAKPTSAQRPQGPRVESVDLLPDASATSPDTVRFMPGSLQNTNIAVGVARDVDLPVALPVNARISYDESSTAKLSSPMPGRVNRILKDTGDRVVVGETVIEIESPEAATATAELRKALSAAAFARASADRARILLDGEVIARKDFELAVEQRNQAESELRRAEGRNRSLGIAPDGTLPIKTPIAGWITERRVNPGQQLGSDPSPLMVVSDLSRLWVMVDLPERDLSGVQVGQRVEVEVDAYSDESFPGIVSKIGAVVDPDTRRVTVRVSVRNEAAKLKPEMFARVSFLSTSGVRAARIPNGGLIDLGARSYVFIETSPGTYQRVEVKPMLRDKDASYVLGLTSGARVVTQGALLLNSELNSR